jgi:hypothetical protein
VLLVALLAIYGSSLCWLEGDLSLSTTLGASCGEHLARASVKVSSGTASSILIHILTYFPLYPVKKVE